MNLTVNRLNGANNMHVAARAHDDCGCRAVAVKFSPIHPDELSMTLARLLGGAIGCNIALDGSATVGQEYIILQNGKRAKRPSVLTNPPLTAAARVASAVRAYTDRATRKLMDGPCSKAQPAAGELSPVAQPEPPKCLGPRIDAWRTTTT